MRRMVMEREGERVCEFGMAVALRGGKEEGEESGEKDESVENDAAIEGLFLVEEVF